MAQWRDESELRILVGASLSAQYLLVFFALVRQFNIPPWLKFLFRLAHVGSDALAIFALATLFNRRKNGPSCSYAPGNYAPGKRDLELLWAPILLMHLGGQVVIGSYKIEDNERSTRYILTSLSKVAAALYVFYMTWSSNDKKLLAATVLLFIMVTIRCFEKAMVLKSSSFNALRKANSSEVNISDQLEQLLHFIVEQANEDMDQPPTQRRQRITPLPCQLLLDCPCPYSDRLPMVRHFRSLGRVSAFEAIEGALSDMTRFLYTKNNMLTRYLAFKNVSALATFRMCTVILTGVALVAAMFLSFRMRKQPRRDKDTFFTVILFIGTTTLEIYYLMGQYVSRHTYSGRILQHSLIRLFGQNRRHSTLRRMAGWLSCKDSLDSFWQMEPSNSCIKITDLVRLHVETGWKEYIKDPYSYRMFNDTRGEWTLARNRCLQQLGWSTRRPFDESIVLWHLATDFCFHHTDHTSRDGHGSARLGCKEMSNYMVHLLFDNPEMLLPGSRETLLATAYKELEVLLGDDPTLQDEKELTRKLFEKCEALQDTATLSGDAWRLAQSLLRFNETMIWELIQGVWVEMLCFSASRCRGYLHAEALGTGREYLSYVWLVLLYTGMETFPEKLQRREVNSFVSDELLGFGLARGRGGAITPLAAQSESTMDIVLEA